MTSIDHQPEPLFDFVFRANLDAARQRRGQDGYRLLNPHQGYCPACGFFVPTSARRMLRYMPFFCENCGRMLVGKDCAYASFFTDMFTDVEQEVGQ